MYLDELNDQIVHIHIEKDDKSAVLDTNVITVESEEDIEFVKSLLPANKRVHYAVFQAVYEDEALVVFNDTVHITLIVIHEDLPYEFIDAAIINAKLPTMGNALVAACGFSGKKINRRTGFRVSIITSGIVKVEGGEELPATVKDLSTSGGSVIIPVGKAEVGDVLEVNFSDLDMDISYKFKAVRRAPIDESRELLAGRVITNGVQVAQYVNKKQQERLKAQHSSAAPGPS